MCRTPFRRKKSHQTTVSEGLQKVLQIYVLKSRSTATRIRRKMYNQSKKPWLWSRRSCWAELKCWSKRLSIQWNQTQKGTGSKKSLLKNANVGEGWCLSAERTWNTAACPSKAQNWVPSGGLWLIIPRWGLSQTPNFWSVTAMMKSTSAAIPVYRTLAYPQ